MLLRTGKNTEQWVGISADAAVGTGGKEITQIRRKNKGQWGIMRHSLVSVRLSVHKDF